MPAEKCSYCGRFMAYECDGEYGEWWKCSRQAEHILADPEYWSVDVLPLGEDAVDIDGDPISGLVGAHRLTTEQLRIVLGLSSEPVQMGAEEPPDARLR